MPWVPTMMFYFPLGTVAAYKALYELVFNLLEGIVPEFDGGGATADFVEDGDDVLEALARIDGVDPDLLRS